MTKRITDSDYIRLELSISGMAFMAGRIFMALAYLFMALFRLTHPHRKE